MTPNYAFDSATLPATEVAQRIQIAPTALEKSGVLRSTHVSGRKHYVTDDTLAFLLGLYDTDEAYIKVNALTDTEHVSTYHVYGVAGVKDLYDEVRDRSTGRSLTGAGLPVARLDEFLALMPPSVDREALRETALELASTDLFRVNGPPPRRAGTNGAATPPREPELDAVSQEAAVLRQRLEVLEARRTGMLARRATELERNAAFWTETAQGLRDKAEKLRAQARTLEVQAEGHESQAEAALAEAASIRP